MRQITVALAAALLLTAGISSLGGPALPFGASVAKADDANPCAAPSQISPTIEETAWELWIAATCPVNQTRYPYVVWQNWIEQEQMYPVDPANGLVVPNAGAASGAAHLLHASPLTLIKHPKLASVVPGLLGGANENCNMAGDPPKGQPKLMICEEVRLGGATEDYISGNSLWNRTGQAMTALYGEEIEFSPPSVEIKADWIELTSIGLNCSKLPASLTSTVHVETINGNCFALAGMHLISKLLDNWVWATFEPQNLTTNPNRCKVLGCSDVFGSNPAVTHGANTALTNRLLTLMYAANLSPEWFNYRLDGVQTSFLAPNLKPTLLGNSIIEGENADVPLTQASCISCHAVSSIKSDGTDGITLLIAMTSNPVGLPAALPSDAWIRRDFVWSLFLACPNSTFLTCTP
jgi:hypothetical protein